MLRPVVAIPARVDPDRGMTIDEDVIIDSIVASSTNLNHFSCDAIEYIAINSKSAGTVIKVDAANAARSGIDNLRRPGIYMVETESVQIVEKVITNRVTPKGPVAAAVKCAAIGGVGADMMKFVEFDQMIVAVQPDARARNIMNQVMGNSVSNAVNKNGGATIRKYHADIVDVVIHSVMTAAKQAFSITAGSG